MTTSTSDLEHARFLAIEQSGWGRSFTLYQPRNLAFWVYALLTASGALLFASRIGNTYGAYSQAILVTAAVFAVYGALLWWFTHHVDRYARQPTKILVVAFCWGGFAATWAMAAYANNALISIYGKLFGHPFAQDWGAGLAAPFTEETAKGFGLLLLIALAPRLVRTAFDGLILGAFLGLGFEIIEDVAYGLNSGASQFGANQVEASLSTVIVRVATGAAGHLVYTALFCAGLVYLLGRPAEPRRAGRGLLLMGIAMLLHGLWDSMGNAAGGSAVAAWALILGMMAVAVAIAIRVFVLTVPREREFLAEILAPEVAAGAVTSEEALAACGNARARRAFRRSGGTRAGRARQGHVLDAVDDLADALAAEHGAAAPRVEFARAEVARLREGRPPSDALLPVRL
ncbi:PrsW family intramembrane metalloprotease [Nocardia asteroides]|uniref:PrsW family intramembrane metalloprotease n=1 Tax=Nocardia asteroides TaxID=1824 RepID=UPI001E51A589|nr:PrsW family intramembrane metalloprotease [Nocardia asteroides]UGT62225.1 PrsW family intramembrane metalloprotease [Nocardia asteroides]